MTIDETETLDTFASIKVTGLSPTTKLKGSRVEGVGK